MEPYEIYDAESDELRAELRRLRTAGAQHARMVELIEEELEERGLSTSVLDQLNAATHTPASAPDPAPLPAPTAPVAPPQAKPVTSSPQRHDEDRLPPAQEQTLSSPARARQANTIATPTLQAGFSGGGVATDEDAESQDGSDLDDGEPTLITPRPTTADLQADILAQAALQFKRERAGARKFVKALHKTREDDHQKRSRVRERAREFKAPKPAAKPSVAQHLDTENRPAIHTSAAAASSAPTKAPVDRTPRVEATPASVDVAELGDNASLWKESENSTTPITPQASLRYDNEVVYAAPSTAHLPMEPLTDGAATEGALPENRTTLLPSYEDAGQGEGAISEPQDFAPGVVSSAGGNDEMEVAQKGEAEEALLEQAEANITDAMFDSCPNSEAGSVIPHPSTGEGDADDARANLPQLVPHVAMISTEKSSGEQGNAQVPAFQDEVNAASKRETPQSIAEGSEAHPIREAGPREVATEEGADEGQNMPSEPTPTTVEKRPESAGTRALTAAAKVQAIRREGRDSALSHSESVSVDTSAGAPRSLIIRPGKDQTSEDGFLSTELHHDVGDAFDYASGGFGGWNDDAPNDIELLASASTIAPSGVETVDDAAAAATEDDALREIEAMRSMLHRRTEAAEARADMDADAHTEAEIAQAVDYASLYGTFEHVFAAAVLASADKDGDAPKSSSTSTLANRALIRYSSARADPTIFTQLMRDHATRTAAWLALKAQAEPAPSLARYFRIGAASGHDEVGSVLRRALGIATEAYPESPWIEDKSDREACGSACFDLLWTWSSQVPIKWGDLLAWQRVNHYPGAKELTRKDLLKRHLARCNALHGGVHRNMRIDATAADAIASLESGPFAIMPLTFLLPNEYVDFCEAFALRAHFIKPPEETFSTGTYPTPEVADVPPSAPSSAACPQPNLWIMKPVGLSRGRGIRVVDDISQVIYGESTVVQRYEHNPLLLNGYKFDLRLYVLVTSFNPLEAFVYEEGFARFTTAKYTLDPAALSNRFVHLTNSSVNKENVAPQAARSQSSTPRAGSAEDAELSSCDDGMVVNPDEDNGLDFLVNSGTDEPENDLNGADGTAVPTGAGRLGEDCHHLHGGTKCSLSRLWQLLRRHHPQLNVKELWSRKITDVILKSLFAVEDRIPHHPNAFELYGYDILIDADYKPWLIEVNASPSLGCGSPLDDAIKPQMIHDLIQIVDPLGHDREALLEILTRRGGGGATSGMSSTGGGLYQGTLAESREALSRDLSRVLRGKRPRQFGEMPEACGAFRRISPSKRYESISRFRKKK